MTFKQMAIEMSNSTTGSSGVSLPVQFHSVKPGRLGRGPRDIACLDGVVISVQLVHAMQHVALQKHAYVVLSSLQKHSVSALGIKTVNANRELSYAFGVHLHPDCQDTTRTSLRWPVGVCVVHLRHLQASVATEPATCRPSGRPDLAAYASPRSHCLQISSGSQSGDGRWGKRISKQILNKYRCTVFIKWELTLLAASRACSISSLMFLMSSVMLAMGEFCEVKFSTSEILSFSCGMVLSNFSTANKGQGSEHSRHACAAP